jgi:hypothetical protein
MTTTTTEHPFQENYEYLTAYLNDIPADESVASVQEFLADLLQAEAKNEGYEDREIGDLVATWIVSACLCGT